MVTKSCYYFTHHWWDTKKHYAADGVPDIKWDATYPNGVEINVREAASAAVVMAVCADWNGYLPSAAQLDLADLRSRAARLAVGVANKHRLSTADGWGHTWQSGYWTYIMGLGAWLVWDNSLTNPADREKIAAILIDEADFQLNAHRPEIWKNVATTPAEETEQVAGKPITNSHYTGGPQGKRVGDSAMEEDIWNSTVLDLAATMMPSHPHAAAWRRRAAQYVIVGRLARADALDTTTLVNGFSPHAWVVGTGLGFDAAVPQIGAPGYNLESNYILWNHAKRNPDYSQADAIALANCLHHGLANSPTPEAMRWNSEKIYGAMRTTTFSPENKPFYHSTRTPALFFPDRADWGNARHTGYWAWDTLVETQITGLGKSTKKIPVSPTVWERLHGDAARAMQDRRDIMPFGQIVLNKTEDSYPGCEGWHALHASFIVLNRALTHAGRITWTNEGL